MKEFEFFHGAVLVQLLDSSTDGVKITRFNHSDNAAYVIDNKVGLYIKYSTARLSPWMFSFTKDHQLSFNKLTASYGKAFVALICNEDGVACLSESTLQSVLDDQFGDIEWIRVDRPAGGSYRVRGSDGSLEKKVPRSTFPRLILEALSSRG
ncbi:MAG: hypothetical protein EB068_01195 [Betaproteobacteria bacterium]|nr:hypothetical protein [Betaproteobacteria bacterium]